MNLNDWDVNTGSDVDNPGIIRNISNGISLQPNQNNISITLREYIDISGYDNIGFYFDISSCGVDMFDINEYCSINIAYDNDMYIEEESWGDTQTFPGPTNVDIDSSRNNVSFSFEASTLNDSDRKRCCIQNMRLQGLLLETQTNVPTISNESPSITINPTNEPTNIPSINPTHTPTNIPSIYPTIFPTNTPSNNPTILPTNNPSVIPSKHPSATPTHVPVNIPLINQTVFPTNNPSEIQSIYPTISPTLHPTKMPSKLPSGYPTTSPTLFPTLSPTNRVSMTRSDIRNITLDTLLLISGIFAGSMILCCLLTIIIYLSSRVLKNRQQHASQTDVPNRENASHNIKTMLKFTRQPRITQTTLTMRTEPDIEGRLQDSIINSIIAEHGTAGNDEIEHNNSNGTKNITRKETTLTDADTIILGDAHTMGNIEVQKEKYKYKVKAIKKISYYIDQE